MSNENEKLKAALSVVSDSILHGWTDGAYLEYVKAILPDDYNVSWNGKGVRCISSVGIDDEEIWEYVLNSIKRRVGKNFQEIYHNINYNHKDFIIYIKQ